MAEMQTAITSPNAASAFQERLPVSQLMRQTVLVVLGSAIVAVCAHISVPLFFTPVPLTMQNFAVLLLGLLLEPATVFASMTLYLIEGASGIPVFTPHGPGGLLQLLGPTGGFLLAYPFVAGFVSLLSRRIRPVNFASLSFAAACASVLLYLTGAAWLSVVTHAAFGATLKMAVLPFVPGDTLKVLAAAAISLGVTRFQRRTQSTSTI